MTINQPAGGQLSSRGSTFQPSKRGQNLENRITDRVCEVARRLYGMPGCGAVTAAKIMGETALVTRFSGEAAFAQHAGLAPVPHWSGRTAGRMRRPKYGNRQLNSAVHRIAVTQLRLDGPGRDYYHKRLEAGDTRPMALRALKRRIGRVVYGHRREDHRCRQPGNGQPANNPRLRTYDAGNYATGRQRQEPPPLTGSSRTTATRRSSTRCVGASLSRRAGPCLRNSSA